MIPTQYIVLHQSCRNHPGVLACQAAHAASESIRSLPVHAETNVVALVADTAAELERLSAELQANGIPHVLIREPDPPYFNSPTAVGIAPMDKRLVQPYVRRFRLLLPDPPSQTREARREIVESGGSNPSGGATSAA